MRIFVCGYPSAFGGADTELWHVLKLWKRFGLEAHLLPTSRQDPVWRNRCDELGLRTTRIRDIDWEQPIDGLENATVVSFCNGEFLQLAPQFRKLGCKLVWVNCMTWLFGAEIKFCEEHGPFDAYVFQSQFQQDQLYAQLGEYGVTPSQCHLIRGAFDITEFPYAPRTHAKGEAFYVGKLARNDPDKWHKDWWKILGSIRYRPLRAQVMAWGDKLLEKLGQPPEWAETLAPCKQDADVFLRKLHALLPINGGARENWPRVGLEAMASGVPVIAPNAWGWKEMISHGETGLLAADDAEFSSYATELAHDERQRLQLAQRARERLVDELACPDKIWTGWRKLFDGV